MAGPVNTPAGAAITGVGMAVPERLVSNAELAQRLGIDEQWIVKRTGTRVRPWASAGDRLSDFAARAGQAALERAGVAASELDLILVATTTADEMAPNAAPLVAGLLGAGSAGAMDVGAACTGWLAAMALATGQIEAGRARHVLVIGADFLSQFLDLSDRATSVLFADGAGAAVISRQEIAPGEAIGPVILHADAAGAELIRLERGGPIQMQGSETFRAAVDRMSRVTDEALEAAGVVKEEIDLFVYHQANSRILKAVGERLGLPGERVVDYVGRFANSSTATLPIALTTAEREGRLRTGDRVLLSAFGGGFTWGATVVRWSAANQ
ncbi:MAG TPA: beta-ketoacyl-ACP synthase III [Solirubrobacteraceae bacterium]|nr:beta-ketoacyl-ACP synthase III [Solirubrobacteraceae bacterium]